MGGNDGETATIEGSRITHIHQGPRGREYADTEAGKQFTRRNGKAWQRSSTPPPEPPESNFRNGHGSLQLMINVEVQGEGREDHWSLFVAREAQLGSVYQVLGKSLLWYYLACAK